MGQSMLFRSAVTALRVSMGCLFLFAGIQKILDPTWSAAGYLMGAKTFPEFYHLLATPGTLPLVNLLNEWGLTLIGLSLIAGLGVRLSGVLGAGMMLLYYFPVFQLPMIDAHTFIVDEHIIYAAALLVLATNGAGKIWGLDGKLKLPVVG